MFTENTSLAIGYSLAMYGAAENTGTRPQEYSKNSNDSKLTSISVQVVMIARFQTGRILNGKADVKSRDLSRQIIIINTNS